MARPYASAALFAAFLLAGSIAATPAAGQTTASDSTGSKYLKWDPKTRTVTFELIAGGEGAKSPFNFNGYIDGEANLVVPPGASVVMPFYQADGTPHSAEIIADTEPMPNMGSTDAAIPRAYTSKVVEGLPQESRDTMRFTAPDEGSFRIFCGVPGHGLSGMWIRFTVDPEATKPRFETEPAKG
jgi:sulfocyanin